MSDEDKLYFALVGWKFYVYDDIEMDYPEYWAINPTEQVAIGERKCMDWITPGYPDPITCAVEIDPNDNRFPKSILKDMYEFHNR